MGKELAIQIVGKGGRAALVDIDREALLATAAALGEGRTSVHVMSVSDAEAAAALPGAVMAAHGQVDGLINNAGIIQPFVEVEELPMSAIERVMQVNFWGTLYLTKAFLPILKQRPEAHIVNVSSMGGFIPFPGQTLYGASKAAVKLLTEGLYAELKESNVRVTVVHPGAVQTKIMANSGLGSPEPAPGQESPGISAAQAAREILTGIERNRFRVLVGPDARMLDKLYRLAPRWAVGFITKQMAKLRPQ